MNTILAKRVLKSNFIHSAKNYNKILSSSLHTMSYSNGLTNPFTKKNFSKFNKLTFNPDLKKRMSMNKVDNPTVGFDETFSPEMMAKISKQFDL